MATKEIKKVAGYIRVSTAEQVEGESLTTQNKGIVEFAKLKGWDLVDVYADKGLSGAKIEHRIQLQQMIKDAKEGKFELILFYKLSRFARNAREYQNLSHELEQHEVRLASVKEGIDPTTQTGKLISGVLALFAEWEHETIKEQMSVNRMAKWKDLRSFVGRPPYGYIWNKEREQLEINQSEAKIYKRIVNMYINQGKSYSDIVIDLNNEGLKCKKASWSSPVIGRILKNPAYYGNYVVNQYVYEDSNRGAGTRRTKKMKPASEHINFPIEAMISKSEWDNIQKIREFRRNKSKHISELTNTFYLRDILYCQYCGGKVKPVVGNKRKDGTQLRYYSCYWSRISKKQLESKGRRKCWQPIMNADQLEKEFWSELNPINPWDKGKRFEGLFTNEKFEKKMEEYEGMILRIREELNIEKLFNKKLWMLDKEVVDMNKISRKIKISDDKLITIESTLDDTLSKLHGLEETKGQEDEIIDYLRNNKRHISQIKRDIKNLDFDDRKILVEAMVEDQKVLVRYDLGSRDYPPDGFDFDFKWHFSKEILQRFADENKIKGLSKKHSNNSSTH